MAKTATRPKAVPSNDIPKDQRPLTDGDLTRSVSALPEPNEQDIRIRAYHRYLERGQQPGLDFDDWIAAKRDLELHHVTNDADRRIASMASRRDSSSRRVARSQG